MVTIRSVNEIILSLIDFFKLAQPDLDTKPGTVARDLFIDGPASQLSLLYDQISTVSSLQSLNLVVGSDLDKLAKNFGLARKPSTPSSGQALFTFSAINSTININSGDTATANNGFSFSVSSGVSVNPSSLNFYRSIAAKYRDQLDFAGISDQYAVQVNLRASSAGTLGNIGPYSINKTNIPGVSNVTNVSSFAGGTDQESDAAFRTRILASFSGSSVGTTLGYLNTALTNTQVSDAAVIGPGNPLMTRDGTVVSIASDGTRTIVSEGSGGKVDVIVLGSNLVQNTDSFIYQDKSNNNDPTNSKNNFVLGQIAADANKTVNRKRIDDIANGILPAQPVSVINQVTGSQSGSNFVEKSVDSYGRVTGNYELVKDTGVYAGSPWGFDTFKWISNKISLFSEDRIKGQFNGQDATTFSDILEIPKVQQNISITNENSIVTSDRSIIQLLHTPATNVTRVFNVNTGERYIITNQNLDATTPYNNTGRIQISGNTLPAPSDNLQVDYSWVVDYDQYSDFDGLSHTNNPRPVTNSIDWGYSSLIRRERVLFTKNTVNNFYTGTTTAPITTVITADKFSEVDGPVSVITSGKYINRLAVNLNYLPATINSVKSVVLKNTNSELYATSQADGLFTVSTQISGIQILYGLTVILPTDTIAQAGDIATVVFNAVDVFHAITQNGSSSGNQITIPSSLVNSAANNLVLEVNYIANVTDLFSSPVTSLPASRAGSGYMLANNSGFNNFSIVNNVRRENQVVQLNLSNQFYVELNVPISDFTLLPQQVVSVVRLSDGVELWNANHRGTINNGLSGNYQLIFSGFNNPQSTDRVLVIYYLVDNKRFEPFTFSNSIIKTRVDSLSTDPLNGNFVVAINSFTNMSGMTFKVIEPNTDIVLFTGTDGVLTSNGDGTALFTSSSINFTTAPDLINKKISLVAPTLLGGPTKCNNDGSYDILSYNSSSNIMTISNVLKYLTTDRVSVVRVADGKEIWNYSGTIDLTNNRLIIPKSLAANAGDIVSVIFFNFKPLRKSPTRISATTVDQVVNTGIITAVGTTLNKVADIVFTATNTGLKQNLSEAVRKYLGLNSTQSIPSNIKLSKLIKAQKVVTVSPTDDTVLEVLTTYDIKNTTIKDNLLFSDEMLSDSTLQSLDFILPNTTNNSTNSSTVNIPTIGNKIRVTFYYTVSGDSDNLSYTRNGTVYSNKKFCLIDKIYVSSGFKASQSTRFTASSFTQPGLGARYKVYYDYTAPKQNERIVISYNYNKVITDVTFSIESSRPINADVLAKSANQVLLDLTMNVVIDPTMTSSTNTILQNLRNQLLAALTTVKLGLIVDQPTLINVAQAVSGISRARILYFNRTGGVGQVLKVQAQENEYFAPNNVIINTETR
jgi:uncharacterized phage protein gp47/JayE